MASPNRRRRPLTVLAAVLVCVGLSGGVADAATYFGGGKPGADGAGDSYYPKSGNGGYDVADYNLAIDYDPPSRVLNASEVISARATQALSSFNLDLSGLTVDSVKVNGKDATFTRSGEHELVITPSRSLRDRQTF